MFRGGYRVIIGLIGQCVRDDIAYSQPKNVVIRLLLSSVVLSSGLFHYRLKYCEGLLSRCGAVVDRLVAVNILIVAMKFTTIFTYVVNIGTRGNAGIIKPQGVCGTGGYPLTSRGLFRSTTS